MKFFWGLVFAGLGFLLLGTNLGWWPSTVWHTVWLLWPMIFVVVGARFLINDDLIFSIVALILVIATGYLIVAKPSGFIKMLEGRDSSQSEQLSSETPTNVGSMTMKISIGAAKIEIGSLDKNSKKQYELKTTNLGKIETKSNTVNGVSEVTINEGFSSNNFPVMDRREFKLNLSPNILTNLNLNSGASSLNLDLSGLNIERLDIKSGASTGEIRLGEVAKKLDADIDTGASRITILAPRSVGLRVDFDDSALNGKNISSDFDMTTNGNVSQTKNYDNADKKIDIKISAGVSNFEIKPY